MEVDLQTFRDELSTWNHDLTDRAKTLDDQIAQLDRLSKIWKSTLQLPELFQTAPEIAKRVGSLIDSHRSYTASGKISSGKGFEPAGPRAGGDSSIANHLLGDRTSPSQRCEKPFRSG